MLLLLAGYHRLLRLPAGVTLELEPLRGALPALLDLLDLLAGRAETAAVDWREPLDQARAASQ